MLVPGPETFGSGRSTINSPALASSCTELAVTSRVVELGLFSCEEFKGLPFCIYNSYLGMFLTSPTQAQTRQRKSVYLVLSPVPQTFPNTN